MNTQKKYRMPSLQSRMVFRLWFIMMLLVLLGIGFMWVAQIYLFEQNYVKVALAETEKRLEPIRKDLSTQDLADDGGVDDAVELLEEIAEEDRDAEAQEQSHGAAPGQIFCHNVLPRESMMRSSWDLPLILAVLSEKSIDVLYEKSGNFPGFLLWICFYSINGHS